MVTPPERLPEQDERRPPGKPLEQYRYVPARRRYWLVLWAFFTLLLLIALVGLSVWLVYRPVADSLVLVAGDRDGTRTQQAQDMAAAASGTALAYNATVGAFDLTVQAVASAGAQAAVQGTQAAQQQQALAQTQAALDATRAAVEQQATRVELTRASLPVAATQTALARESELQATRLVEDLNATQAALNATGTQSGLDFALTRTAIADAATATALAFGGSPAPTLTPSAAPTMTPTLTPTTTPTPSSTPTTAPVFTVTPTPPGGGTPVLESAFSAGERTGGWRGPLSRWQTGEALQAVAPDAWLLSLREDFSAYAYEVWLTPAETGDTPAAVWFNVVAGGGSAHSMALLLDATPERLRRADLFYFTMRDSGAAYDTLPVIRFEALDIPALAGGSAYHVLVLVRGNTFIFYVNGESLISDGGGFQDPQANTAGAVGLALSPDAAVQHIRVTLLDFGG